MKELEGAIENFDFLLLFCFDLIVSEERTSEFLIISLIILIVSFTIIESVIVFLDSTVYLTVK